MDPFVPTFCSLIKNYISDGLNFVTREQTFRQRRKCFIFAFVLCEETFTFQSYLQLHKNITVFHSKTHLHKAKLKAKWYPYLMILMKFNVLFLLSGGKHKMKLSLSHSISVNASLAVAHTHVVTRKIVLH